MLLILIFILVLCGCEGQPTTPQLVWLEDEPQQTVCNGSLRVERESGTFKVSYVASDHSTITRYGVKKVRVDTLPKDETPAECQPK